MWRLGGRRQQLRLIPVTLPKNNHINYAANQYRERCHGPCFSRILARLVKVNNLAHKFPLYYFALHLLGKHPSIISMR